MNEDWIYCNECSDAVDYYELTDCGLRLCEGCMEFHDDCEGCDNV